MELHGSNNNITDAVDDACPEEQFICDFCYVVYDCKSKLASHILTHTEFILGNKENEPTSALENEHRVDKRQEQDVTSSGSYLCYICERPFLDAINFLNHMKTCADKTTIIIVDELLASQDQTVSFQCLFCELEFSSEELVQSHLTIAHASTGNEFSISAETSNVESNVLSCLCCKTCNTFFLNELSRKIHLCGKDSKCRFCDESFFSLASLWIHLLSVHCDENLSCTFCSSQVFHVKDLIEHLLLKHKIIVQITSDILVGRRKNVDKNKRKTVHEEGKRQLIARSQRKQLKEKSRLTIDGKEKFACKECPSIVNTFSSLVRHMAYAHCDDTPYQCSHCPKAFKTKNKLRIHKNSVHERTRSYDCQFCGRGFAISSNLTNHLRIHTGEKPYVCDECGMKFAQSSSLYSHKVTHKQDACHVCMDCGKGFLRPYQLRNHRFQKHLGVVLPKYYTCDTCGSGFQTNSQLRRHLETHNTTRSYICELCNAAFTMRKYLVQHYKTHGLIHFNQS